MVEPAPLADSPDAPPDDGPDEMARHLVGVLSELAAAVDADLGVTLQIAGGDGVYADAATSVHHGARRVRPRLFGGERTTPRSAVTMLVSVPDERGAILRLARSRQEPFSDDDRAMVRLVARQLTGRLVADGGPSRAAVWSRQLEAVQRVAAQLTRITSVSAITEALCSETRLVIPYDNIRVHLLGDDGQTLHAVAFRSHTQLYDGETVEGLRSQVGEGLTGLVAASGRPLVVRDVAADARAVDIPDTPHIDEESMLLVPMRHDAATIGVITLSRLGLGMFTDDDLRLLEVLADQVAVAVENARLLAGRDRLLEELRALLDIGQAGTVATDETTLAATLVPTLRRAARADGCAVARWDAAGGRLEVLATDGPADGRLAMGVVEATAYPAGHDVLLDGRRRMLSIHDLDRSVAERAMLQAWDAACVLLLPLTVAGRVVGVAELACAKVQKPSADEVELYAAMANHAAAALENARLMAALRTAADIDQVTGVTNHRYLQERLKQEVARSGRTGASLSVLMIDLDGFKLINDRHGHADGDRVLRNVAAMLKQTVRTNDVVARYGGDEFVILMPDTQEDAARHVADRVVKGIRGYAHPLSDGTEGRVSCSVGLAVHPTDGRTAAALLRAADAAMYGVKRAGGSRVGRLRSAETAPPPRMSVLG